MTTAIHVTHEAVHKIGGIGTVLDGLIHSKKYNKKFRKTLLYAPLFSWNGRPEERLGETSKVLYSGKDSIGCEEWKSIFKPIEQRYNVKIVYGKKLYLNAVDIVVIDIWSMSPDEVNKFKFRLWKHFGIESNRFENDADYEQYLRIGAVLRDVFEALYGKDERAVLFAHEYMGVPSGLGFAADRLEGNRKKDITVFYAHEVATARLIVENSDGHDISFYNIMRLNKKENISLEHQYGDFSGYIRNELIKKAHYMDHIFAVSNITKDEYEYLCPNVPAGKIKVVFNGISSEKVSVKMKKESIKKIQKYCSNLFRFTPDYIMTHVARLIISKAIWRDIRLLYHLDEYFHKNNLTGFFAILSTQIGPPRPSDQIHAMESDYGWPTTHKEGWPDLVGFEIDLYKYLEMFNAKSKAIKGVFINQFGFSEESCGKRVPEGAKLLDLRLASDVEFGFSIYEPFGIAQLETLPYGGMPAINTVCGCFDSLAKNVSGENYVAVDFTKIPADMEGLYKTRSDFMNFSREKRDLIESIICADRAEEIFHKLPKNNKEREKRFKKMQKKAPLFDWDHVSNRIAGHLF